MEKVLAEAIAKITSKGQVTIPKAIRDALLATHMQELDLKRVNSFDRDFDRESGVE